MTRSKSKAHKKNSPLKTLRFKAVCDEDGEYWVDVIVCKDNRTFNRYWNEGWGDVESAAARDLKGLRGKDVCAFHRPLIGWRWDKNDKRKKEYNGYCGQIFFRGDNVTHEFIAHECFHAAITFSRRLGTLKHITLNRDTRRATASEEILAYVTGALTEQITHKICKNYRIKSQRN